MADFPEEEEEEGFDLSQDVILVPADKRDAFLQSDPMHIRIVGDDGDTWEVPHLAHVELLQKFLSRKDDKKIWVPCSGTRLGYDDAGVFIHESHMRHYFGILRSTASLSLTLETPEAVPKTGMVSGLTKQPSGCTSEGLMGKLLANIPCISDEARQKTLKALFNSIDTNSDGTLNKSELIGMMRKVLPGLLGKQVMELWIAADTNRDNRVDLDEFVTFLYEHPGGVRSGLAREFRTEADCVRASFRVWDTNGDGLITMQELRKVLKASCPGITDGQIKILSLHMDMDKDGRVGYDEFVHFLFHPEQESA